jgi:F-type H+-transporting ATPase subunit b
MAEMQTETGAPPQGGNEFPPLDTSTFVPQLFWLAIAFTLLYVLLDRLALPGVVRVIKDRRQRIAGDLDAAEGLRREADAALKADDAPLAEARPRAVQIVAEARSAIKAEADRQRAAVDSELAKAVAAAEARIAEAKDRALDSVRTVAIDVAGAIVEKVLKVRPAIGELGRAVDEELRAA